MLSTLGASALGCLSCPAHASLFPSLGLSESCQFACVAKVLFTHPASTFLCELGYLAQVALGILLGFPDLLLPAGPGSGLRVVELIPAQPYQVPVTLPNS